MKMSLKISLVISVLSVKVFAQTVNVEDFASPAFPGFNIINVEPKTILRPTTPAKFATTVLSGMDGKGGLVPDVAIEVSPIMLSPKNTISFYDYISDHDSCRNLRTWNSLAFSVATSKDQDTNNLLGTKLGLGFRIQPLQGKFDSDKRKSVKETSLELQLINIINIRLKKFFDDSRTWVDDSAGYEMIREMCLKGLSGTMNYNNELYDSTEAITYFKGAINGKLDKLFASCPHKEGESFSDYAKRLIKKNSADELTAKLKESTYARYGHFLEFAGATAVRFPTNSFEYSKVNRIGFWVTHSYRSKNRKLELSSTLRYFVGLKNDSVTTNFDFGTSLFRLFDEDKFVLSFEVIGRSYSAEFQDVNASGQPITRIERDFTYRCAFNAEYKLSDQVSLTATFGKDFDSPFYSGGNLLSILGLNWALPHTGELKVEQAKN